MTIIRKNERSWEIELISQINQFTSENDLIIKRAGGESTVSVQRGNNMFPDVVLYGDKDLSSVLQGWELKMPDVPITDDAFLRDAQRKAKALNLNSYVIWNFTNAKLYVYNCVENEFEERRNWKNQNIKTRGDVNQYKSDWEKTLKSVLLSVNEYLISGELKKIAIGDAFANFSISRLVNENKSIVADLLLDYAKRDSVMEAELETWWKDIKIEYSGDETNKYKAYAKNIIINWINRIIFAHLIKRTQRHAFEIDKLDFQTTPQTGNCIFQNITNKSDFYNIFSSIPYSELLPSCTWEALVELSLLLKDSPIEKLPQHVLHQVLENSVNISKRLVNGQYPTPSILAAILSRMTIHNVHGNCYDGCCGTGTIPKFIINFKKEKIGISHAMSTTWASDKFKFPLQIANLAMTDYNSINMPCRLFQKDILNVNVGDVVEIVNPQTGNKDTYSIPLFDAIVSNLPFIKSGEISDEETTFVKRLNQENKISGRSDFSYYIAIHLNTLVKVGGYVGIILSNSFLGTEAGYIFLDILRKYFDDLKIHISGNGRWFTNADVVTALLVMRRRGTKIANNNISFFTWNKRLDLIASATDFQDIIINSSILDKEIDSNVITRVNYSDEEVRCLRKLNVSYNSLFSNLKWLLEIKDKLTPISTHFDVFRGSRRGWDALFFPKENTQIEDIFLKDVLINAKSTNNFVAMPTPDRKAFCCNMEIGELEKMGYKGALAWIRKFEKETNGTNKPLPEVLAFNGMKWYELTTGEEAEIFTMMNPDNRMFYAKFNSPTFINQRLIGLRRKKITENIDLLHALLNSILSLFYIEAVGFGRGLGVLDINKDSISKCYMLNPNMLTESQKNEIIQKFNLLISRGIKDIEQDLNDSLRKEFDRTILKAFGIVDYYDYIVSSLKAMRNIRKTAIQRK